MGDGATGPRAPARRFLAIARQAGWRAALGKVGRKLRALSRIGIAPVMSIAPLSAWASGRSFTKLDPYAVWKTINRSSPRRQRRLRDALESLASAPCFSVLMPVYNTPPGLLGQAIASVAAQSYESWELIIVEDGSSDPAHFAELESWSRRDPRIKAVLRGRNSGISIATNAAAELAMGDFLLFLDHDDLLHPDALAHLAISLDANPDAELIYTDDDKISVDGKRHSPQFKPGWSPELLLWFCYVGHLKAVRASLFRDVGGMRAGFEGSQDHDFFLRAPSAPTAWSTCLTCSTTGGFIPVRRPRMGASSRKASRRADVQSKRLSGDEELTAGSFSLTGPGRPVVRCSNRSCPTMGRRWRSSSCRRTHCLLPSS